MDLVTLKFDAFGGNDFYPESFVEGYSSLIWTERYSESSEFVLETYDVRRTLNLLVLNKMVSLLDSREIMVVEEREIATDEQGKEKLVVKGRDFASVILSQKTPVENHFAVAIDAPPSFGQYLTMLTTVGWTRSEHALFNIWEGLVGQWYVGGSPDFPLHPPQALMANIRATETISGPAQPAQPTQFTIQTTKSKFENMRDNLVAGDLGFRCLRPPNNTSFTNLAFGGNVNAATRTRTTVSSSTFMRIDVYRGVDRTPGSANAITFSVDAGDLLNVSTLQTTKDIRNIAWVQAKGGPVFAGSTWDRARLVTWPAAADTNNFARRVMVHDMGNIDDGISATQANNIMARVGLLELAKHRRRLYLDASIRASSRFKFREDYDLGDMVGVEAHYGLQDVMQVSEYIRTQDVDGERGYPTLVQTDFAGW